MNVDLISVVAWPFVAIMVLIFASFGWLDKPFKSLGEAIRGLLSGVSKAKEDLIEVEARLSKIVADLGPQLTSLGAKSDEIQKALPEALKQINERMKELADQVSNVSVSVVQQQVASDLDEAPDFSTASLVSKDEAMRLIGKIQEKWNEVFQRVIGVAPELDAVDGRRFGAELEKIAERGGIREELKPVHLKVVSLHKRFRSFSRMRGTAELWMTHSIAAEYTQDADDVIKELQ